MRRLFIIFYSLLFSAALLTSCLDDNGAYNAGFVFYKPAQAVNTVYANNTVDSIVFFSYGRWGVTAVGGQAGWCKLDRTDGNAETIYSIPVRFTQNATGESRSATYRFVDAEHPDEAYTSILYWQYATRGDGTLGSAAEVKTITGSDGSRFEFTYDEQHRPTTLYVTKDGTTLCDMSLRFNDYDSTLTVTNGTKTLSAKYGNDYQPQQLVGENDTVGYYTQYYNDYIQAPASYAFNIEHHSYGQPTKRYALKLGGQSLLPDSLHNADSLRIADGVSAVLKYKLAYSAADNRRQSVDVNQLIFGTEQCDPYQLLSLFRYARNTSVVSEATDDSESGYVVEAAQNADGSVSRLVVKHKSNGVILPDIPLEYTFEY